MKKGVASVYYCQFCRMSLFKKWTIGKQGVLGIWQINESIDQLCEGVTLSAEEQKTLDSFSYDHRKKEWITSRLLTGLLSNQKNTQIVYDEYNKPYLKNSNLHISISHSHNLLAVILDGAATGIDIELIKNKVVTIKEKFMSQDELSSIAADKTEEQLTAYWCAKESLYKLYGKKEIAFKENIFIEPFTCTEKGLMKGWIKTAGKETCYSLHYEKIQFGTENYLLSHVLNKD